MRGRSAEAGFTLIEILIVTVLIGILAALAIPIFTGQRTKAQDADAKSNARNIRVHVESCAVQGDNTYADCATAAQIQSGGLPVGMVRLPPLGQFAAASGSGSSDNNGINNGAQCIPQSNGTRSCEQTSSSGTASGSNVDVGGSAPGVGDCVEGGTVESGCVGIIASVGGYTVTAVSKSNDVFQIANADGRVTRPCDPPGRGGCPGSGGW